MKYIESFTNKIVSLPTITINQRFKQFFSIFLSQSIFFLLLTPLALSVPAYLFSQSFSSGFSLLGVGILLLVVIVLFTWLFISLLFLLSVTDPHTRSRWAVISWLGLLLVVFFAWAIFFKTSTLTFG